MIIEVEINLAEIMDMVTGTIDSLDLSGLGVDGASIYEVVKYNLTAPTEPAKIYVEVQHVEGKFTSKEQLTDTIKDVIMDPFLSLVSERR